MPVIRPTHSYQLPVQTYSDESSSPPSQKSIDRDAASDRAYTTTKKRRGRRTEERVPRPRNAFIIFRSHYINSLKVNSPTSSIQDDRKCTLSTSSDNQQNELSKQAAKVWNKMNLEERKPYAEHAKKEKEWHRRMYPDYMYCPANANGKGKRTKSRVKKEKETETLKAESKIPQTERFLFQHEFENPYPSVPISQPTVAPVSNPTENVAFQYSTAPSAEVEVIHSWGSDYCVRQLEQENAQYYTHNGFASKHDFIPMDAIPPLALCPSSTGFEEVSCKDDQFSDLRQPAFAVDLSPRSLAYEQAKTLLDTQSCSPTSVFAFFAMQSGSGDGGNDTNASSFASTSEDATPTPFVSAHPDPAAYFPSSSYSSFYAESSAATTVPEYTTTTTTTVPDWTENPTCFDFNFSSSYVEPVPLSFFDPPPPTTGVPFGLEIDVPQFDFFQSLGDASSEIKEGADRMLDALFNFGYCEWL